MFADSAIMKLVEQVTIPPEERTPTFKRLFRPGGSRCRTNDVPLRNTTLHAYAVSHPDLSNRQIAQDFGIAITTVNSALDNVKRKMNAMEEMEVQTNEHFRKVMEVNHQGAQELARKMWSVADEMLEHVKRRMVEGDPHIGKDGEIVYLAPRLKDITTCMAICLDKGILLVAQANSSTKSSEGHTVMSTEQLNKEALELTEKLREMSDAGSTPT